MSAPYSDSRLLIASGKVNTDGTKLSGVGQWTPARSGAGIYTITLPGGGVPEGEEELICTSNTAGGAVNMVSTSATVKTVNGNTYAGPGTAVDTKFSFEIWQNIPGS